MSRGAWRLALACGALAVSGVGVAKDLTCTASSPGVSHKLTVSFANDQVQGFRYLSITTNAAGYTCDVSASKTNAASWVAGADGLLAISLAPEPGGGKPARATVLDSARMTTFRFLDTGDFDVHHAECGLNGVVAPVISLVKGSRICRLESSDEQH